MRKLLLTLCLLPSFAWAQAIAPSGSSSTISGGVTPTSCSTTQVLFALAGKVSCDLGFTYAGASGTVSVIGSFAVPGILFSAGSMIWRPFANPAATIAFGNGQNITWDTTNDGGNGTPLTGLSRFADGVVGVNGAALCSAAAANCRDIVARSYIGGGSPPATTGSTCASVGVPVGGNSIGSIVLTCTAQNLVLTFAATAPNFWYCHADDMTTPADLIRQTARSNTTATFATITTVAGDVVQFACFPY